MTKGKIYKIKDIKKEYPSVSSWFLYQIKNNKK